MLNPNLNRESLAAEYKKDDRIRIQDILDPEVAERIRACCLSDVPFEYIYHLDGKNVVSSPGTMAAMDRSERQEVQDKVMDAASRGVGFLYRGYMIRRAQKEAESANMHFLHSIFEYVNSKEMLSFIGEVSGRTDLMSADAQFTSYTSGHFLTRHSDEVTVEERRLAYVFGFSEDWHPDWGGLLQFYEDDGTPRDAWAPQFNTLSLFDIRHIHAVTYVTPFARNPRLSLTGWFRSTL